jgi:hypothetical protein
VGCGVWVKNALPHPTGTEPPVFKYGKKKKMYCSPRMCKKYSVHFETPAFKYGVSYTPHPIPYTLFIAIVFRILSLIGEKYHATTQFIC